MINLHTIESFAFAEKWAHCWYHFFGNTPTRKGRCCFDIAKANFSSLKFPCLHLITLSERNKNQLTEERLKVNPINTEVKAIYYILNESNDYSKTWSQFSSLRKREIKFGKKNYLSCKIHKNHALDLLKSSQYKDMHYQFYKSFPSPELPIKFLILLVEEDLLILTAYYTIKERVLIGATFSCHAGSEYYIPFVIYNRSRKEYKGLSTFIWNVQIEYAVLAGIKIVNLGTSSTQSNVAKFKRSLGGKEYIAKYAKKSSMPIQLNRVERSTLYRFLLSILPRKIFSALGFLAYKYFGAQI